MFQADDVFTMAANLLNDQNQTVFTDAYQQPYLNMALRELGQKLELSNQPITNQSSVVIPVPSGITMIGGANSNPQLPTGLVEIQQLWQRWSGTTNPFIPVQRYEFLPHQYAGVETSQLMCWAWFGNRIEFYPANTDLEIKLDFIKSVIPNITASNQLIEIPEALNYLGYKTAALCAMYIGENPERASVLNAQAEEDYDRMMGIATKGRQTFAIRRRPFMMAYKNRGVW